MTEPLNHKLDVSKIKTLTDVKNIFECMCLSSNASEEHEKYELLKEYFTLPNEPQKLELPRKSIEEISQEFDEKIDKQIEDVEYKFAQLKYRQEYQFSKKITRIIDNFEYARENGSFPTKLDYSKLTATGGNITSNFVIKEGGKEVGFYTFGNGYLKYYMNKKPTAIVRFFMNKLLGFRWEDT
jgi:vacuolar-type H+-ATPase subunit I/STV1